MGITVAAHCEGCCGDSFKLSMQRLRLWLTKILLRFGKHCIDATEEQGIGKPGCSVNTSLSDILSKMWICISSVSTAKWSVRDKKAMAMNW
mmetsp:Transcript_99079/g.174790  ORF Transcript_99079/g.174790 Transcript_99079/m.174790 type:complete len:91 (+) Transcript_99079:1362-1634(+)